MKRFFPQTIIGLVLTCWSQQAAAVSCEDLMKMVNLNINPDIILSTMQSSGKTYTTEDIECLQDGGAPDSIINQAKKMARSSQKAREPEPTRGRDDDTPKGIDDEEELNIQRSSDDFSEDSTGNDPSELKQAIKLYQAKRPLTASFQLFKMLEEGAFPDQESKIQYYLARALSDLEMFNTAQYYYLQVIKKGPGDVWFNAALPKMVSIARYTGDDSDLKRIVAKLPADRFPRKAKNHLHYLAGVRYYNQDELSLARENFAKVSSKSTLFLKSRYIEGVIYNETDKYKSAVRAFRDVYQEELDIYNDPRELTMVNNLKDLSLINIASIYYGIERYDEASSYYDKVDRRSAYWPESLFRDAWSHFMIGDLNVTLGKILTIDSPYFHRTEFIPEATVLKALTYFNLCEYGKVDTIIKQFEADYVPMRNEIDAFLNDYSTKEKRKLADQAWDRYFGDELDGESTLPESFFARVLRNQDLNGIVRHLDIMEKELEIISSQKPKWRDSIGVHLTKLIETNKTKYKKRAGRMLLAEMERQKLMLSDLLSQSQIIAFEVVDAQRLDYEFKASNLEALGDQSKFQIDFATSSDLIYWPFNGEFWADELGYYHYTEQGSCK